MAFSRVRLLALSLAGVSAALAIPLVEAQAPLPAPRFEASDPACQSRQLVSVGGPFPKDRHTLAIRWTGYSNFELAYNGRVLLLDAYFDRGGEYPPLGFAAADVRKADVILIGHGHYDHMSDAASVGIRTGATIVGAPITVARLQAGGSIGRSSMTVRDTTPQQRDTDGRRNLQNGAVVPDGLCGLQSTADGGIMSRAEQ